MSIRSGMDWKAALGVALLLVLVVGGYWMARTSWFESMFAHTTLEAFIDELGRWAPIGIMGLMIVAIVFSPIPSGPIAMVAGAAFGAVWGTVYVLAGSTLGAVLAFSLARWLGYDAVRKHVRAFPRLLEEGGLSQNALMGIVFASRLVPFISFDAISYAAGLTPLRPWRFGVATVIGTAPIAFLLVYAGQEAYRVSSGWLTLAVLLLGGITVVPLLVRYAFLRYRRRSQKRD